MGEYIDVWIQTSTLP